MPEQQASNPQSKSEDNLKIISENTLPNQTSSLEKPPELVTPPLIPSGLISNTVESANENPKSGKEEKPLIEETKVDTEQEKQARLKIKEFFEMVEAFEINLKLFLKIANLLKDKADEECNSVLTNLASITESIISANHNLGKAFPKAFDINQVIFSWHNSVTTNNNNQLNPAAKIFVPIAYSLAKYLTYLELFNLDGKYTELAKQLSEIELNEFTEEEANLIRTQAQGSVAGYFYAQLILPTQYTPRLELFVNDLIKISEENENVINDENKAKLLGIKKTYKTLLKTLNELKRFFEQTQNKDFLLSENIELTKGFINQIFLSHSSELYSTKTRDSTANFNLSYSNLIQEILEILKSHFEEKARTKTALKKQKELQSIYKNFSLTIFQSYFSEFGLTLAAIIYSLKILEKSLVINEEQDSFLKAKIARLILKFEKLDAQKNY